LAQFTPTSTTPSSCTSEGRAYSPAVLAPFDGRNPIGRGDVRDPSGGDLEALAGRFMHRLQYQNRGGIETWVSNITVNVSGVPPFSAADYRAAPRYFELRRTSPGGAITAF